MSSNALIRFVVSLCMLAGLIVGHASFAASSHAMTATAAATVMPDDMDCCPKKQTDPGSAKCPLMALCSSSFAERAVELRLPVAIAAIVRRTAPVDEASVTSRSGKPIPEPPRS